MLNQTRYLQNYTWNDLDQDIELHLSLELISIRHEWINPGRSTDKDREIKESQNYDWTE